MAATQSTVMNDVDPHGFGAWFSPAGLGALFFGLMGVIPIVIASIGGAAAMLYYVVCLWESKTVQKYVTERHERRTTRRVAILQMRQASIAAELKALGVLVHADTSFTKEADVHRSVTTVETQSPAPKP